MTNPLRGTPLNWISDGKPGASFEATGENELTINGGKHGTPFNLRVDTSEANYYFGFTIQAKGKSSISIGVVTPSRFLGGWKTKGMFYNGNLTNGSAAKAVSWGPRFEEGDSIGVRVIDGGNEVVFYKNGKSLGTGFALADTGGKAYCPCIHIDGDAKIAIEVPAELPPKEVFSEELKGIEGPWKLVEAVTEAGVSLPVPSILSTLTVARDGDTLKLHMKVGNPINGSAQILQEKGNSLSVEMGHMMSGRMMSPPGLREIEALICGLGADTISLSEDGKVLTISKEPKKTVWERNPRNPQPLTSYH
jgi:hypothetical protein